MRLSTFILTKMEPILQEWEDFARALGTGAESMDVATLRDHAEGILRELAEDLETHQSDAEQEAKSKGLAPAPPANAPDAAAELHGNIRAVDGFTLGQMVSEYRALRASVLRLWAREGDLDSSGYEQVTRFNEAIDEALAKSVKRYGRDLDRLMAAARAQERLAALGTLSAGLGHDMGNVLMPMAVWLRQLEESTIPAEARSMVDWLRRSVEHLRGLTRGLRALSVDPDDAEASPETTELHEWWTEATSPYKWALGPHVHLHASGVGSSALPKVRVPKHVLTQAVFNIVQNAGQAMAARGGGNIWVSAAPSHDGATVALTVRDDGPGMDAQTLARCTEPFFTTNPRARGTGLGLTLVRTAVERHGGRLVIESEPGRGSSFTLVLPAVGDEDPSRGVRGAIVTVRDPRMQAMVSAILSGMGVQVSAQRQEGGVVREGAGKGDAARGSLWVADDSIDTGDVQRFLDEGGPDARVVRLGGILTDQGAATKGVAGGDGRLIQIAAAPSHAALRGALRGAMIGWAS